MHLNNYATREYLSSTFDTNDDYSYPGELYGGQPLSMHYLECDMKGLVPGVNCFDPAKHPLLEPAVSADAKRGLEVLFYIMHRVCDITDNEYRIIQAIYDRTIRRDYAHLPVSVKHIHEGSDAYITCDGLLIPSFKPCKEHMSYNTCLKYFNKLLEKNYIMKIKGDPCLVGFEAKITNALRYAYAAYIANYIEENEGQPVPQF